MGLADNGTIEPVGLPWIIPRMDCTLGANIIVQGRKTDVYHGDYEQIDCLNAGNIIIGGYESDINSSTIFGTKSNIYVMDYKATVITFTPTIIACKSAKVFVMDYKSQVGA